MKEPKRVKTTHAVLVFVVVFIAYLALNSWDWWINRREWVSTTGGCLSWGVLAVVMVLVIREARRRLKKD